MADEVQKGTAQTQAEEVVVVADVPEAEEIPVEGKEVLPETKDVTLKAEEEAGETDKVLKSSDDYNNGEKVSESTFKEESTKVSDLSDSEKKAVDELRQLVQEALDKHEFSDVKPEVKQEESKKDGVEEQKPAEEASAPAPVGEEPKAEPQVADAEVKKDENVKEDDEKVAKAPHSDANVENADDDGAKTVEAIEETIVAVSSSVSQPESVSTPAATESKAKEPMSSTDEKAKKTEAVAPEEVSIWGIPLLADARSDVILLKFLRARDFKVKEAFTMLKNTIKWRKEFGIDELIEQDLGDDYAKTVFMYGVDKEGHPVCYNVYGEFQDKELYQKCFSDEEKRNKFLKWRIQFLEKSIRKLDFSPGGISTIVQVNDLKNSPGPTKRELRQTTKQALQLLQDNYPEFVAKQVFINVPWWYLAFNKLISPFLTQRTKSKFVLAGPSKSAETLFRYISGEQIPVKYGGLSKDGEFDSANTVTEVTVKAAGKHAVEFPVSEACVLTWELRVVGWEVNYGAEFVPNAEESYTVIIQKPRKISATEQDPVLCNSFKIGEPGKVVLTIDNPTSKKKKLVYRLKTKVSSD